MYHLTDCASLGRSQMKILYAETINYVCHRNRLPDP